MPHRASFSLIKRFVDVYYNAKASHSLWYILPCCYFFTVTIFSAQYASSMESVHSFMIDSICHSVCYYWLR